MASEYSSYSKSPSGGELRRMRMYVSTSQSNTETQSKITVTGNCRVELAAQYGIATIVGHNGGGGTSAASHQVASGVMKQNSTVASGSHTYTFNRKESAYTVTFYCKNKNQTVSGYGAWNGPVVTASVSVTIPARVYSAHGKPTISASKTTANYGESVTISWGKSSTQGNASFSRFELWQGNTKLYSGSAVSKSVKPSDVTGAKGGPVTYTIKEIHTWYGSEKTTSSSVTITVRSGVVSAYDSSGKKHTGLVTAYDSSGKSHYVLITAYDSSGKAHSVV